MPSVLASGCWQAFIRTACQALKFCTGQRNKDQALQRQHALASLAFQKSTRASTYCCQAACETCLHCRSHVEQLQQQPAVAESSASAASASAWPSTAQAHVAELEAALKAQAPALAAVQQASNRAGAQAQVQHQLPVHQPGTLQPHCDALQCGCCCIRAAC